VGAALHGCSTRVVRGLQQMILFYLAEREWM